MSLGYSLVSSSDQVLQPNLAGGANPSGAHFVNPFPQFSSIEGARIGCGGGGSTPAYNIMKGGGTMRRFKRGRSSYCCCKSRRGSKRRCHCKGRCRCHCAKSSIRRSKRMRRGGRSRRGGASAAPLSAAPFAGGANAPYQQYMAPHTMNFSVGGSIDNSAMANPPPITRGASCNM
jgi:hypothetical protein